MRNLYHKNKGKVHPSLDSPPPNRDVFLSVLKLLPAAILALVSVLSVEDREVLAYLITRSMKTTTSSPSSMIEEKKKCKRPTVNTHKIPIFECGCFDCYTRYWYRWDSSPNRELISQAIEAFEDHLAKGEQKNRGRKKDKSKTSRRVAAQKQVNKSTEEEDLVPALLELEKKSVSIVLESEILNTEDPEEDRGADNEEEVAGNLTHSVQNVQPPAPRKVVPDVFGLFNSRFWSLWNPNI